MPEGCAESRVHFNVLYRLTETKAPDGYAADAVRYFMLKESASDDNAAYSSSGAANAGVNLSDIELFKKDSGGTMYITDRYTRLTVQKTWANQDGSEAGAPDGASVKLQLYRSTMKMDVSDAAKLTVRGEGEDKSNPYYRSVVYLDGSQGVKYVKKGSEFVFKVHGWNIKYRVLVNGEEQGVYENNNVESSSITLDSVNADSSVVVQVIGTAAAPGSITTETWTDPKYVLDDGKAELIGDAVTVDVKGGWTHSWDNLDEKDSSGNTYYYTVKELGYTVDGTYHEMGEGASYQVTYSGNTGIQTGTIMVTNTSSGYSLPSTGGTGTTVPIALGASLAALAAAGLVLLRRKGAGHRS